VPQGNRVPFKPWRPSLKAPNSGMTADVDGVLPRPDGFTFWPGPVQETTALPAASAGAVTVFDDNNNPQTFGSTQADLFHLQSGTPYPTWANASSSAGAYHCDPLQKWQFAQWGQTIVAVNINDVPQTCSLTGGDYTFSNLAGSPPKARLVHVYLDFMLLANLSTNSRVLQWSAINDNTTWTPGVNLSDTQELADGGPIYGLCGTSTVYVLQAQCVRRMTFSPGSPETFDIIKIVADRGCECPDSIVELGDACFFLSRDGFWMLDGSGMNPISANKIDQWLLDNVPLANRYLTEGMVDPVMHRVYWSVRSTNAPSNTTGPDLMLCYDFVDQEWTKATLSSKHLLNWVSQGYALDQLGQFGNLDNLPYSLDSAYWQGKRRVPGVIGNDNILYSFTGSSLAASIEVMDFQPMPAKRIWVSGITLDTDCLGWSLAMGSRERFGDPINWGTAVVHESTGAAGCASNSRLIRPRFTFPAGATWRIASGFVPELAPAGDI
jgi:hypothetical protein